MMVDQSRQGLGLLDAGDMPGARDELEPRPRNEVARAADEIGGRRAVLVAGDAEGRGADGAGIRRQVRVADGRAGSRVALDRGAREHVGPARAILRPILAVGGGEPAFEHPRDHRPDAGPLHGRDPLVPGLRRADLRGRAAQDQGLDPAGRLDGHALGDHAAHRQAHDRRAGDGQVVQETEQVPEVIVEGVGPVRRIREAVAPQVVENDPEAVGEGRSDPVPDAQVAAQGIGEDQGGPFPGAQGLVVQDDAVHALECHAVVPEDAASVGRHQSRLR